MPAAPQVENLKPLTSLRFVAAFMIVIHHAPHLLTWKWPTWFPGTTFHGVSFFFVLSGFILTHVYSTRPLRSYGVFVRARMARLWPVHAAALVLLVLSVTPESITFDGPGIFSKWVTLGFNLSLLHSLFPFLGYTFSWNSVSWSISTELFFYLAFPFLIVNIERTWKWKLAGSALLAVVTITSFWLLGVPLASDNVFQATAPFGTYPNPLVRGFEFCTGMATWVLWNRHLRHRQLSTAAWTLIEVAIVLAVAFWLARAFWWAIPFMNQWVLLWYGPIGSFWIFAILIAVFATGKGRLSQVLSISPLVFLGEISFSIYMLHQILMKAFVTTFACRDVPETVYLGALFVLASLSYLLIEKPGQRLLAGKAKALAPAVEPIVIVEPVAK